MIDVAGDFILCKFKIDHNELKQMLVVIDYAMSLYQI
jgi:hypothetical protein